MEIKPEFIARQSVVANIKGAPVTHIRTLGGLEILCWNNQGSPEVIASSPHIGISNFIAQKKYPDIVFTELKKSEPLSPYYLEQQSEYWSQITSRLNELLSK